ncbi:adenosine receptor A1 isoform X2 [Rhinoderma darwinii]|uniref:adenosine receptor A1 isoform X2 n=2 Tax=Rhinoderma darwinii TaxID=43563 RepID=UPI003F67948C
MGTSVSLAVYIVIEVLIALVSVLGNILVIWAVIVNQALRDTTFFFIVSLAVADIAVGALVIPLAIIISIGLETEFYSCLMVACIMLILTQSSILALLAIAMDRYLRVKIPTRFLQTQEMFLSQKYLQVVTFLGIVSFAYLLASENTEKERSVAETQLMHDTGKMMEEINRQRWLQSLLETIHNTGRGTLSMFTHNKERSVAEAQLMHDKGKTIEEITRQRWLQSLLGAIHNPGRREAPHLRNLHREVHGISTEEQQRLSVMKNNRNLQYKSEISAYSKKMTE